MKHKDCLRFEYKSKYSLLLYIKANCCVIFLKNNRNAIIFHFSDTITKIR